MSLVDLLWSSGCGNSSVLSSPAAFVSQWKREKDVYRRLKEVSDKALATSGYSEINLAKLFQAFSTLK